MASEVDEGFLKSGWMFDGSSIAGWKSINESDMKLMPDVDSGYLDPFYSEKTYCLHCNVVEPESGKLYGRDP
jgi:glutamine synthetase